MLVNSNTHSLWRSIIDDQQSLATRGSAPAAFLAPHSSNFTYGHHHRSRRFLFKILNNKFPCLIANENNDDDDDSDGDYADVLSSDYQIDRKQIQMIDSLGNGQFGEVYRGIFKVKFHHLFIFLIIFLVLISDGSTIRNKYCYKNMQNARFSNNRSIFR
jgi:hypothetical protein